MTIQALTPEAIRQVREIASQVFQEHSRDLVRNWEHRFQTAWAAQPAPVPDWVETTLRELAEAQKRTEERVAELIEAQERTELRVEELAEAQKRTEERVEELAEAQKRTELRVEELAEAQKHAEERLTRLEATVAELAEAQKHTEEQIALLVATQRKFEERLSRVEHRLDGVEDRLERVEHRLDGVERRLDGVEHRLDGVERRLGGVEHRLGVLDNALGVDTEVDAQDTVMYVLEQKGYRCLERPRALDLDGEVDIVLPAETPEGERVWVLVEAKARARLKELRRWHRRLHSPGFVRQLEEQGITPPFLFYLFGLRVYRIVENEAQNLGLGVLDPNGERVEPTLLR